jgi:hypothetical protein
MHISEFLQKYIIAKNSEVGYLAQHQLFEQVFIGINVILLYKKFEINFRYQN